MTVPDDRAREALDHLQAAGLELIAAARAFLDVAEDLVREPAVAGSVVRTVSALTDLLNPPGRPGERPGTGDEGDQHAGEGAVEHIHLS